MPNQIPLSLNLDEQDSRDVIAEWMNSFLPEGVTSKVAIKGCLLKVILESAEVPDQAACIDLIRQKVIHLHVQSPWQMKVYGREEGEEVPEWQEEFEITSKPALDLTEKAREGDIEAINNLISQWLDDPNISSRASIKNGCLRIVLEAREFSDPSYIATQIFYNVTALAIPACTSLKISGREPGDEIPDWQQAFDLQLTNEELPCDTPDTSSALTTSTESYPSRLELAQRGDSQAISDVFTYLLQAKGLAVATKLSGSRFLIVVQSDRTPEQEKTVTYIRGALEELKIDSLKQVSVSGRRKGSTFAAWTQEINLEPQPNNFWGGMLGVVGGAAMQAGGAVSSAAGMVGNAAAQTGGAIAGTAVGVASAIGGAAMQATDGVGHVIDMVMNDPNLKEVTKALKVDWLLAVIDRVDVVKAATEVKNLQDKSPGSSPGDIAHQIMVKKALLVGGSGFASSLVPGMAASLFAVDLAATMALQAEMVYQIAYAYGMNLQDPARKGEVLAIFGMALGGSSAIKAGLSVVRNIPGVGAVIGASSNAAMLYALGYAACRFYAAKLNPSTAQTNLLTSQLESQRDLQMMSNQQIAMDMILLHLVLAGNPGRPLQQLLPEVKLLNLSPVALDAIREKSVLPPLEELLLRLNQDFAIVLIAQCQKIAHADGIITHQEAKIIETITTRFNTIQP